MADDRLRAHLGELGAAADDLAGLDNDGLISLAGDMHLRAGLDATVDDVARAAGCDPARVRAIYEGLGLRADDLAGFGDGDIALTKLIVDDTSGIVDTVGPQLLRVAGSSLSRLAEATVAAYVQDVEDRDDARDLVAEADQNALASMLVLVLGDVLPTIFRHHMWAAVHRQRHAQSGVATSSGSRRCPDSPLRRTSLRPSKTSSVEPSRWHTIGAGASSRASATR
jgi:hypothetical protein